ncbi:amino acid permease [Fodinisporobacter ferrooxydans]|uniref:Amino acid permease n=1 Tax=Fodinisporobacter ferrooxydans TaxID=2901836 RepID=A0ABY4CK47_9BACL|nr:amino acid permease [Alicyclobacillaceae bacterium MYW30-H2]
MELSNDVENSNKNGGDGLHRSLSNRQIQMLAIGGVIGVGLFYGAATSVKLAGPGVLLVFVICGILAALVMRALGEMTVENPIAGSFSHYAGELLGTQMGFLTSGMWWFYWVATVMSELAAIGSLLQYWFPSFPAWIPGLIALILFTFSNMFAVKIFGEVEYWFAFLKVTAVIVFMIFGGLIILTGIFNNGHAVGLTNLWTNGGFLPHGWLGAFAAFSLVVQAYSGIETLAVEAGESQNPASTMRRAFRSVTIRISIFYIGSILIMLSAFPWNYLIEKGVSPYVLLFSKIGIPVAAGLVNLIIILSALSSCNTGVYGGSRMLYGMASKGLYNPIFTKLNKNHVPHIAVWATAAMISIGIFITYLAPGSVYVWITSASAFASLWTWGIILVSEIVHRKRANRRNQTLKYPMPLWPTLPIFGLILLMGAFVAILTSPLTKISVYGGIIWLAVLVAYYNSKVKKSLSISDWNQSPVQSQENKIET